MSKFKVGDRVRVYGFYLNGGYSSIIGMITRFHGSGLRVMDEANGVEFSAHPKQCRRLVPKKKPEAVKWREEVWISDQMLHLLENGQDCQVLNVWAMEPLETSRFTHLVELRNGELIINREILAKVWVASQEMTAECRMFQDLCTALGLPAESKERGE